MFNFMAVNKGLLFDFFSSDLEKLQFYIQKDIYCRKKFKLCMRMREMRCKCGTFLIKMRRRKRFLVQNK